MSDTYQTQFTQENVVTLSRHIQRCVGEYAKEKDTKLDLFVIAVALQQAAYEIMLRSLTESKEQAEAKIKAMLPISEVFTKAFDEYRANNNSFATEELLGAVFGATIITEFYAHHRDEQLIAMGQSAKQVIEEQAQATAEIVDAEIVK